jgi:hypothetical protein
MAIKTNVTLRIRAIDPGVLRDVLELIEAESKGVVILDHFETRE